MELIKEIKPIWFNSFLGIFMPIVVKFFINKNWSRQIKFLIAFLFSFLIGTLSVYLQGKFFMNTNNFEYTLLEIFSISQIAYNLFWKDLFEKSKMKGGEFDASSR
ncbi:MAG: hypothetical protein N3D74_04535 [Caldisericia bacterium]|nr:hypothetical protein [Caldisericia bacterium]